MNKVTNVFAKYFFFPDHTTKHKIIFCTDYRKASFYHGFISAGSFVPALPEVRFSLC